jgi:hypothetical protein
MSGGVIYGRDAGALANKSTAWASGSETATDAADAFSQSLAFPKLTADALSLVGDSSNSDLGDAKWGNGSPILDSAKYPGGPLFYSPPNSATGTTGWGYGGTVTGGSRGTLWTGQ